MRTPASVCSDIPGVCKRWNALYASPSLWDSLVVTVPMGRTGTPPWKWVQRRLPGAEVLKFETECCHKNQQENVIAAELEGELITAHLLLVLSHAQTHKLGELGLYPAQEQHQYPELNSQVSEAISRFTLLTALSLDSLEVEADTLQVSTQ